MIAIAQERSAGSAAELIIQRFKTTYGVRALLWCVLFAIGLAYTAPDTWHRDLVPTRDWFLAHPNFGGMAIGTYGPTAAIVIFVALPIVINSIASEMASYAKVFAGTVLAIAAFDHWTDWPVNYALFVADWPQPAFTTEPLSWLWWFLWLILTQIWFTDILEVLTAACLVGLIVSFFGIWRKPPKRPGQP